MLDDFALKIIFDVVSDVDQDGKGQNLDIFISADGHFEQMLEYLEEVGII